MGACCSKEMMRFGREGVREETVEDGCGDEGDDVPVVDHGARMRLHGASSFISMHTQQGRKGVNQDAMTVWEDFTGEKGMMLCGVFDGHGPHGHKVSRHVRDTLPSRLSTSIRLSKVNSFKYNDVEGGVGEKEESGNRKRSNNSNDDDSFLLLSSWEAAIIKSFREMDEELSVDASIDSFCSGSTAVVVVKQGNHLIISNLGDSRAVLGTRPHNTKLVPLQLTVDLKPNVTSEAERIRNCNGRVFALDEDPNVFRIWLPDEDCPGLAMARAFGDFCLKDYGLIAIPEVSYRRITKDDEFVVLATDGIWDVLSNDQVVKIVASAKRRSTAARLLIKHALRAWRNLYPGCKIDDCAVVCLFLKSRSTLTRSYSQTSQVSLNHTELEETYSEVSRASISRSEIAAIPRKSRFAIREVDPEEPVTHNMDISQPKNTSAPKVVDRVNSFVKFPQFVRDLSRRKSVKECDPIAA